MKTLIINGSPHKNGETVKMINFIKERLDGQVICLNTYFENISPCVDCGFCHKEDRCAIDDKMTELYPHIESCDRLVLASPLYFSQLTGVMLGVLSRIQVFSAQKYIRHKTPNLKPKKGIVLLNGGGSTKNTAGVDQCVRIIMRELNVTDFKTVFYSGTDKKPVMEDAKTVDEMETAVKFLNKGGDFF